MKTRPSMPQLMRSLGFTVKEHYYGSQYNLTHWQHKPSGAVVVLHPNERYSAAKIVGSAIASGIEHALQPLEVQASNVIGKARHSNRDPLAIRRWKS